MNKRDEIIKAAHQYASKGQLNDAISEYLKVLPHSVDGNIRNVIGDLYLKKNSTDEAIKYFREAAVIFTKDESHTKAIALYHKILSINPDQHDVVLELAELNAERGFIKQAIQGLICAAEAYCSKGLPIKALGIYKKALSVSPSDINLKEKIAAFHLNSNHIDRAVKIYLAIAIEHEKNAESVKAEEMYKKVISLDPDNIESLVHLSRLAEDDQDLELAFEYLSKAAAIAPDNSEIMLDYSNLAAKANKDISECSQPVPPGPYNNKSQNKQLADAVNNCDKAGNTHEPLELRSENSNAGNPYSSEPVSTSISPLPMPLIGNSSEETGFTVHPDTGETGTGKNGTWDDSNCGDKSSPSLTDSFRDKTSQVITGHENAEAEYDQNTGEYELNLSTIEPDNEKTEKDSRRLKRRVKKNRLHFLIAMFFVVVMGLSFFITFKFIKNNYTADIETPEHVIPRDPLTATEVKARGSSSDASQSSVQIKTKEQVKTKTIAIKKEDTIKADDQGVFVMPVRETDPAFNDSKTNSDSTDDMIIDEEDQNLPVIQTEIIESTIKPDIEIEQEKENTVIDSDTLIVPESKDEMQQEKAHKQEGTAIVSFNETFDNNDNNWDIIQTSAAYVRLMDGEYYIRNRRASGAYIILNGPAISTDHDFEIATHLRSVNPSTDYSFGLVFGAKDREDYFVFQMLSEDEYSIRKYYRGVSLELASGKINGRPKSQELFNVLKIKSTKNKLSFFINDKFIDEVSDISFSNRKTGFFLDGKAEIAVDKILIHQQSRSFHPDLDEGHSSISLKTLLITEIEYPLRWSIPHNLLFTTLSG